VLAGGKLVSAGAPLDIFRDRALLKKYRLKPLAHVEILSALGVSDAPLSIADAIPIVRRLQRPFDRTITERILKRDDDRTKVYGAPVIEADNLSFSYGKNRIISNLDLVIRQREFVALVGPNGSGKPTLV